MTKLASLLIKTLSKPLSKRIKHDFSRYELGQRVLIGIGQASHTVTSRMTIWSAGYKVRSITPLEDSKALSVGADFVGESVVLLVSSGTIVWEYNRSREKERQKQLKIREEARAQREALQAKLLTLDKRLKALEDVVKNHRQSILRIGGGKEYVEPENTVPIDDGSQALPVTPDLETATIEEASAEKRETEQTDKTTTLQPSPPPELSRWGDWLSWRPW